MDMARRIGIAPGGVDARGRLWRQQWINHGRDGRLLPGADLGCGRWRRRGGSGGSGVNGSVHFEVTGEVSKEGDLSFVPMVSFFEHDGPGTAYLIFATGEGDTGLYLTMASNGVTVTYGSPDLGVTLIPVPGSPVGECKVDAGHVDASSASGTFECTDMSAFRGEEFLGAVTLSGTFDAHK